jgi:hypothetical protein
MDWAANAIQKSSSGQFFVSDPQVRQQILDLRNHPETASVMAAELASDNRNYLSQQTGRQPQPVDLYLAHFLGAGGAAKFLNSLAASPNASAASLFPAAARTNASIFYDRDGNARSLADIRAGFAQKLASGAMSANAPINTDDGSDNYSLPPGAKTVLPADYLRIAQALQGTDQVRGASLDASRIMSVDDPETAESAPGRDSDDLGLLQSLQARTLERDDAVTGTTGLGTGELSTTQALAYQAMPTALAPRAETARLAYLMLATLGR